MCTKERKVAVPVSTQNLYRHRLFVAMLFTGAQKWKQCKYSSTDEWIIMWSLHAVEYYSVIKRDEVLIDTCYNMGELWKHYAQ